MRETEKGFLAPEQKREEISEQETEEIRKKEAPFLEEYTSHETSEERKEEVIKEIRELNKRWEEIKEQLEKEQERRWSGYDEMGRASGRMRKETEFKSWQKVCEDLKESYFQIGSYPERLKLLEGMIDFKLKMGVLLDITKDLKEWQEVGQAMILSKKPSERGNELQEFSKMVEKKRGLIAELAEKKRGW